MLTLIIESEFSPKPRDEFHISTISITAKGSISFELSISFVLPFLYIYSDSFSNEGLQNMFLINLYHFAIRW